MLTFKTELVDNFNKMLENSKQKIINKLFKRIYDFLSQILFGVNYALLIFECPQSQPISFPESLLLQ